LNNFTDKIVLVTGGNRGIGENIARAFAGKGARVIISARNEKLMQAVTDDIKASGGKAEYVCCDLAKSEEICRMIAKIASVHGRVDVLINNSGISPYVTKSEEVTEQMWQEVLQVNLYAPFTLCREVGKIMMRHNWGRIINISSIGGIVALPRQIAYCASKAALIQMTKVLAVEWAPKYNITVNAIAPGYVKTDLTAGMRASEKISKNLLERNPSRRFGEVDEITGAVLYLASEDAGYTTGSVLVIDGGMLAS